MARITDSEAAIMESLWRREPLTAEEIIDEVAGAHGWSAATVRTFLNRLLRKKVISAEKIGKRYSYRPEIRRDQHVDTQSQGLLDQFFDGRLAPLVSHFSRRQRLDAQEIAELKRLIEELDDGQ